jgi:glucosamine-6-phosphate deaminase
MKLQMAQTKDEVSQLAANMIQQIVKERPQAVIGLATGSTPIATYQELIQRYQDGEIDFSQVKTFNLDEYYGLDSRHPQSYHAFMRENLFNHINIKEENIHIPSGKPENVVTYCRAYEQRIEEVGGIDLQILGIGQNGHIGFNEPSNELQSDTHLVQLASETIEANARFFERKEDVPRYAITMGIQTILKAKSLLLLVTGKEKAEIIQKLFASGITTDIPASFLKLHQNVTVLVDQEAGSLVGGLEIKKPPLA